jgi:hypothetical protein
VRAALEQYSQHLGVLRVVSRGISPGIATPVRIAQRDVATPEASAACCWRSCRTC